MKEKRISLEDFIKEMNEIDFNNISVDSKDFFIQDKQSLCELRKARWLYLRLGKEFIYNMQAISNDETRIEKYNEEVDYDNLKMEDYVCKQQSEIFAKGLEKINIDAITVEHNQGYDVNHVGTVFRLSNGMSFYTDITLDGVNIKNGLATEHFARVSPMNWRCQKTFFPEGENETKKNEMVEGYSSSVEMLSKNEISTYLDTPEMKYKECGMYTNEFLELLRKEFCDTENVKKYIQDERTRIGYYHNSKSKEAMILKFKFDFLLKILRIKDFDYLTGRDYVKTAIQEVFTEEEKRNIQWFNLDRLKEGGTKEKEFATCYVINCNGKLYYYFYEEKSPIIPSIINGFILKIDRDNWNLPDFRKIKSQKIKTELESYLLKELEKFDELKELDRLDKQLMRENINALDSCDASPEEIRNCYRKMIDDRKYSENREIDELMYL